MALSIRAQITAKLLSGIRDGVYEEFRKILISTHRITGEIPAAPGNEFRNVYDHIVKAANKNNIDDAARNINNAHAHILMATMQCLAISIDYRMKQFQEQLNTIEESSGAVETTFRLELIAIRKRKNDLFGNYIL